jgi:hypothetical protein
MAAGRLKAHQAAASEIVKWLKTTGSRRGLSLRVDRDQLNQIFWLRSVMSSSVVSADHDEYDSRLENRRL